MNIPNLPGFSAEAALFPAMTQARTAPVVSEVGSVQLSLYRANPVLNAIAAELGSIWGSSAGGGGDGGTFLPVIRVGTTTCTLNGVSFSCPYADYRDPIGGTIRQCYWVEGGTVRHSIPCD